MPTPKSVQQVREITERLEQGIKDLFESEKYKEYLCTMSKFYNYSFRNTVLIAMQRPDATYVAGYNSWKKNFDRQVKAQEHGIKILAPAPYKVQREQTKLDPVTQKPVLDADGKPVKEVVETTHPAFKVVTVFDVSQTEGKELPEITVNELTGSVENYAAFFEALKQESPVPISFENIPNGAKGFYSHVEARIAIQEGMSEVQTVKTAIHEIAHAKLHAVGPDDKVAPGEKKDRRTKEVEAESVAYTVCQRFGIETSDYSFGYVAGWSSDKDVKELKGSLETIKRTAAEMIESIDAKLKVLLAEQEQHRKTEIAVESAGKGFIELHETDGGYDYSVYSADMKLLDGGVIEVPECSIQEAVQRLSMEYDLPDPMVLPDYEGFQDKVVRVNAVSDVPIYNETANYAYEAGEMEAYHASLDANISCRDAIERAISDCYRDNCLNSKEAVKSVLGQFSDERVKYVLAATIQAKDHDGRISRENKEWAKSVEVNSETAPRFMVDLVNPGLLDLFSSEFQRQTDRSDMTHTTEASEQIKAEVTQEKAETAPDETSVSTPQGTEKAAPVQHKLTSTEKEIKEAVMDVLKSRIAHENDGMLARYSASDHSHIVMARNGVKIEGNTVTQNGEPLFQIHRKYSAHKTRGCYRQLNPTLEYVKKEQSQEKPSIRAQLKAAAKAQPEQKAPAKAKKLEMGLE